MALEGRHPAKREVLQRKLQRLLWLCRALKRSGTFEALCRSAGQDAQGAFDLAAESAHRLALVNAGSVLSAPEFEQVAQWTDFHWRALEDLWAAVRFFEDGPAGPAIHVA